MPLDSFLPLAVPAAVVLATLFWFQRRRAAAKEAAAQRPSASLPPPSHRIEALSPGTPHESLTGLTPLTTTPPEPTSIASKSAVRGPDRLVARDERVEDGPLMPEDRASSDQDVFVDDSAFHEPDQAEGAPLEALTEPLPEDDDAPPFFPPSPSAEPPSSASEDLTPIPDGETTLLGEQPSTPEESTPAPASVPGERTPVSPPRPAVALTEPRPAGPPPLRVPPSVPRVAAAPRASAGVAPPVEAPVSAVASSSSPERVGAAVPRVVSRGTRITASSELEKNDTRHQAARRFARLAVSEIVLYHEADVQAGRQAKDLWTRFKADIELCISTYDKRFPQEVRDRFDYLYDELVYQLAQGDPEKLGPQAPGPRSVTPR